MRLLAFVFGLAGFLGSLTAQEMSDFWTPVAQDKVVLPENAYRAFEPHAYYAYKLDYDGLLNRLAGAPMEFTAHAHQNAVVLALPMANGRFERFALVESPVMMPGLQARYPEIRTYSGHSLETPAKYIRCGYSPAWGFRAIVLRPDKGAEYIEPLARDQNLYYMVYDRHDFPNELRPPGRATVELPEFTAEETTPRAGLPPARPSDRGSELAAPVVLKQYRFAAACTGEFSQDNGKTLAAVLAKVVDITNKLNAIYERDLDIRLKLVDDEDKIIFLDPTNDPYTGTTVGEWLGQNPLAMATNLGSADKYDIGHVFAKFLGGNALGVGTLGSCCTQLKGRGCSAGWPPYEDDFFAIIGQEIGHQWDGGHTWTYCGGLGPGDFPGSACEPGSGTTIMSYSGSCGSDNVQNGLGDLYYNVCSIMEIRSFVEIGTGSTCGTKITTTNNPPVVKIPYANNFFIPVSTPFELTGSATDPDGDPLTYCWEEIDTGPLVPLGSPVGNTPIFRSFPPTDSPTRTFPRIQTIVLNQTSKVELLPTYSRDLSFALTARDSRSGGGGIGFDTLRFKATNLAGPFLVTYPTGSQAVWMQGEHQIVTWDMANTDKAPVNCKVVNIRLSLDGGYTYPITLASGVANKGRYCVEVPSVTSAQARVRVEAADNVFFDISNANFKIQAPTAPGFSLCPSGLYDTICLPAQFSTVISTNALLGFNAPINLSVSGLPAGATANISPNPVLPGSEAVLTLDIPSNYPESTFNFTLKGESGGQVDSLSTALSVFYNDFTGLALAAPANGALGQDRAPVLRWAKSVNANTYDIQVASNPSFSAGTMVVSRENIAVDTFKLTTLLDKGKVYYWRMRPKNECGTGNWIGPFAFATLVDVCTSFESNDVPKNITATQVVTVESKINVPANGTLSDVNITKVQGNHEFFKDLEMHLIGPSGTDVLLFKDKCPNYNGNFNFGFDDSKASIFNCPPPNNGNTYKPTQSLSAFNGQNASGQWTLRVKDNTISSGGKITAFVLELCSSTTLNPPVLVNNNTLQVQPGTNQAIITALLKTEDANNTADQLVYTLMTKPVWGRLERNWGGEMQVGDQFTQTDLDNGAIRYFDYGAHTGTDNFCFTVTDGEGGLIADCFTIQPFPVGTREPAQAIDFQLAPNPATETLRLAFSEAVSSDTRIRLFDMSGRQLRQELLLGGGITLLLQVGDLPEGIYMVTVDNSRGSGARKIVVR